MAAWQRFDESWWKQDSTIITFPMVIYPDEGNDMMIAKGKYARLYPDRGTDQAVVVNFKRYELGKALEKAALTGEPSRIKGEFSQAYNDLDFEAWYDAKGQVKISAIPTGDHKRWINPDLFQATPEVALYVARQLI